MATCGRRPVLRDITHFFSPAAGTNANGDMTPSPDEQVIELRGRRIQLSPTKRGSPRKSPKKSPPKSPPKTPTRSSPRKRAQPALLLEDSSSPKKMARLSELEPIDWSPPEDDELKSSLSGLSRTQLTELLERAIDFSPVLKEDLRKHFPTPDLKPFEETLERLKRNIYVSFPKSRWGSTRDAFCFRRVSTHVEAFKKECLGTVRDLIAKVQWLTTVQYALMAWPVVQDLPDWDNPSHNKPKKTCFQVLATHCLRALKSGKFSTRQHKQILERLEVLAVDSDKELDGCLKFVTTALKTC